LTGRYSYMRDGAAIYAQSFATIRAEADLAGLSPAEARIAVRVIHACGMVQIAPNLGFGGNFTGAARAALLAGRPVLCDSQMVAHGITRSRLPAANEVICTLDSQGVPELATRLGTTRSAAALELWGERLGGALVAIGNAPTALYRLLELLDAGAPHPAAVIGMPVGFVGAAEAKATLAADGRVPFVIVHGRLGGSAMAVAVVNALASEAE
jgi:precorrin-8X/cobalt-precorrin-8 methylmutase